jgi:hypothetical protein
MQSTAAKNESGEAQDLRLYEKAAEVAYQYAKNKASKEKDAFESTDQATGKDVEQ